MAAHKPNLNVMTWNADSISPKKYEFFDFLLSNDIDIALKNETYLKQGTPFSHPDFRCYRLDREGARTKGGVAILVRQNLPHSLISSFRTKVLECIGISVSSPTGEIHFISTYHPGGRYTAEDIRNFKSDIQLLTSSRTSFFICGD
jgi:exonuclease III